jgi:hypothetical protein
MVNDNGAATAVHFEYGTTAAYGATLAAGTVPAGTGTTLVASDLTGLACGTTYHYRVSADNNAGTLTGQDQAFTTQSCRVYSSVGTGSGNGYISPSGWTNISSGGNISYTIYPDFFSKIRDVTVDGISVGAVANYTLKNVLDDSHSVMAYFDQNPIIATWSSSWSLNSAWVYGYVSSVLVDATAQFEYGTDTTYGRTAAVGPVAAGTINSQVSAGLDGLACGTTYHYRVTVNNGSGVISGGDRTFTTDICPVLTSFTTSSFVYNRATRNFGGSLIFTNIDNTPISGTLVVYIKNLPAGITLANASGTDYKGPYINVALPTPLQPGHSTTLQLQFNNPANIKLTFSADTYRK